MNKYSAIFKKKMDFCSCDLSRGYFFAIFVLFDVKIHKLHAGSAANAALPGFSRVVLCFLCCPRSPFQFRFFPPASFFARS